MNDQNPDDETRLEPAKKKFVESASAPPTAPVASGKNESSSPKVLTPEEQMALYEKDLKENDWGHQPC